MINITTEDILVRNRKDINIQGVMLFAFPDPFPDLVIVPAMMPLEFDTVIPKYRKVPEDETAKERIA